jgi:aspartyl-tRNA(Asn)/glutamyl-tRNA(Gln) amidotransferase subunit B
MRQTKILTKGEQIQQCTLLYDSSKGITKPMRGKEEAADYRYFPDPDLPPLEISDALINSIRNTLPELPWDTEQRLVEEYQLSEYDAHLLASNKKVVTLFEATVDICPNPKLVSNWITSELFGLLKEKNQEVDETNLSPDNFGKLLNLFSQETVTAKVARELLLELLDHDLDPEVLVLERGLVQINSNRELQTILETIFAENPTQLQELVEGKESLLGFFIGQAMKRSGGKANPKALSEMIREYVKKS